MASLPAEVPLGIRDLLNVRKAYDICLKLESTLQQAVNMGKNIGNDMIYIRILGYLIHRSGTASLRMVIQEIISAPNDPALLQIGQFYFDHYIRPCRISTPDNEESPPSFDTLSDMINHALDKVPEDYVTAKMQALVRDEYCCVVTGWYDTRPCKKFRELGDMVMSDVNLATTDTECAHMFSESINSLVDPERGTDERLSTESMWAVLRRFGHEHLLEKLNGKNIHRLENVMTLSPHVHEEFYCLNICPIKNKYKFEAAFPPILRIYQEYVTFTTPDPIKYPVPDPEYLAIHAACARVANLGSGAIDCIEKFDEDMEAGKTLDSNGASANMLEYAISRQF